MSHEFLKSKLQSLRSSFGARLYKRRTEKVIYNFNEFLQDYGSSKRTQPPKNALLSYIVQELLPSPERRNTSTFSNAGIAQYIPRALNELGYSVDIVNYDNRHFIPSKKYDLFIGHGGINFEGIEKYLDPSCLRIYFSTGIYWKEWNRAEMERFEDLRKRRGVTLSPDRAIMGDEEYANTHADAIICLGNDHAKETYRNFSCVKNLNNAVYLDDYSNTTKNFTKGRNNFLFFNGPGNVHKGLDLLLEAFIELDQHLFVRQAIEPDFFKVYKKELTEYKNIHLVPYLKKPSREFYRLMNQCNYVISPTCAEGQPGSIIECMAHGLIPILSQETNIDTKDFGVTLRENSIEEIISNIRILSQKNPEWYNLKSDLTIREIENYYRPEHFLLNLKNAISEIFDENYHH